MGMRNHSAHQIPAPHLLLNVPQETLDGVLRLLDDDDVDFVKLARSIEAHAALAAIIIREVNSVTVGNHQPIESIRHAIALLGLRRIRESLESVNYIGERSRAV